MGQVHGMQAWGCMNAWFAVTHTHQLLPAPSVHPGKNKVPYPDGTGLSQHLLQLLINRRYIKVAVGIEKMHDAQCRQWDGSMLKPWNRHTEDPCKREFV